MRLFNQTTKRVLLPVFPVLIVFLFTSCISMIHRSVDRDDLAGVQAEVESGVSVEATDYRHRTPLQLAAEQGRMEIVRYLVAAGADIDAPTPERTGEITPLRYAVANGDIEMVNFLVSAGADVNKANSQGWTPLMTAVRNGDIDMIDILLEEGADLNARTNNGRTVTRIASDAGYTDVVMKLTLLMKEQ